MVLLQKDNMRNNIWFLLIIIFLGSGQLLRGQILLDELPASSAPSDTVSGIHTSKESNNYGFIPKKITSGVQLGSYFTSFSGNGSSLSTYVSPHISYSLSKRFRINTGITIINTNLFGIKPLYSLNRETALNGNFTNVLVYLSGDYLVNDRLMLSGTIYKEINLFNSVPGKNYFSNNTIQGGYLKVDYKVFENFHVEAGFGYSKGGYPYNNYFGSPCPNSPFIH